MLNDILDELIDLRGYMTALKVKFPEMENKMTPGIDFIDELVSKPSPALISQAPDELYDLRSYFYDVIKIDNDMEVQVKPPLVLIEHLLSSE